MVPMASTILVTGIIGMISVGGWWQSFVTEIQTWVPHKLACGYLAPRTYIGQVKYKGFPVFNMLGGLECL